MRAVDFGMDRTQSGPARELGRMSAFGGKADILRTFRMSANDPSRTSSFGAATSIHDGR
jgi:hypothetical protein